MIRCLTTVLIAVCWLWPSSLFAAAITPSGAITLSLAPQHATFATTHTLNSQQSQNQLITFPQFRLSSSARHLLAHRLQAQRTPSFGQSLPTTVSSTQKTRPASAHLDFEKMQVLDQGRYGSCATFANIGAIDYLYHQSNQFSELCSLELGTYLHQQNHDYPSGWYGSLGSIVLAQITRYGLITTGFQQQHGCAGIKSYNKADPLIAEPEADYLKWRTEISKTVGWSSLVTAEQVYQTTYQPTRILNQVKDEIAQGHAATIGYLLNIEGGIWRYMGSYKTPHDSWVITPEIVHHLPTRSKMAGHEIMIIGYDDNATILGPDGQISHGVLTLRNSWGKGAGYHGNFYMSYGYFRAMLIEAQTLHRIHK